ncbi:Major Facilitator Superfamily protein [Streptosporangium subroseum]|uniref:Major Facilitator Superfamily protein n=1 Tax=Streptosporangium subroseum TaxID=106412 RepID=A0A239I3B2_9ACTN|nr:MFS transporter [Streptosporangium subroseum]SNS87872.1 Major Facilitator Superfamily protein [Streptosporangium subroseum]
MTTQERGATYTEVFANREFRVLFGSFALLVTGDQVKMLALSALVYARTGSPGLSAATYTLGFLPYIVGGTFLLSLADRIRPRILMIVGELLRVVTCLLMAFAGLPVWALLALVLATGLFSPVFGAARSALLPDLLPGDAFVLGRSVLSLMAAGSQIGGLAVGGGILAATGPAGALAVTAALSAVAVVVLRFGLPDFPARNSKAGGFPGQDAKAGDLPVRNAKVGGFPVQDAGDGGFPVQGAGDGFSVGSAGTGGFPAQDVEGGDFPTEDARGGAVRETLRVNRTLMMDARVRGLLLAQWLPISFVTGAEAMLVPYLGGTAGIALAASSVGLAAGNLAVGRLVSPAGRERLALPLAVAAGIPLLAFVVQPEFWGAALLMLLATAGSSYELGLQRRFVEAVAEPFRGQAFGLSSAGMMTGQALGAALVGGAAELTSPHMAIVLAGVAIVLCSLALHRSLRPEPS